MTGPGFCWTILVPTIRSGGRSPGIGFMPHMG